MSARIGSSSVLAVVLALASCSGGGSDGDVDADVDGGSDGDVDGDVDSGFQDELQLCADLVNQHRADEGLDPVSRSAEIEACAAEGAQEDAVAGVPHTHFNRTDGCDGAADAALVGHGRMGGGGPTTAAGVVRALIDSMAENDEPALFDSHAEVGCGLFVALDSDLWLAVYLQ